jgi:hypothetical protein
MGKVASRGVFHRGDAEVAEIFFVENILHSFFAYAGPLRLPAESQWIIRGCAADPTSGSLREGGRDKRVPPKVDSEGYACHARLEGHARRPR